MGVAEQAVGQAEIGPRPPSPSYHITAGPLVSEQYLGSLDFDRLDLKEIPQLRNAAIYATAIDAGAGHLRPLKAISHALKQSVPRAIMATLTTRTHDVGSNNPLAKKLTELGQRSIGLQNKLAAPIVHRILQREDWPNVKPAFDELLTDALRNGRKEVVLLHTNPEPAYLIGRNRRAMETEHGVKIFNALVMTDHFPANPQYIWNLIDMDVIVAPDDATAEVTRKQLQYWGRVEYRKDLPEVIVCGYPGEPFYSNHNGELLAKRIQETDPENSVPADMAIPLGGASPGLGFLGGFVEALRGQGENFTPWAVRKSGNNTELSVAFDAAVMSSAGGQVERVSGNDSLIDALGRRFVSVRSPTYVVVKPGELSNMCLYGPDQVGGAIMLFVEPVGDQEVQNLHFFQSEAGGQVLPSDIESSRLVDFVLACENGVPADKEAVLQYYKGMAGNWRGVLLPKDPVKAARFFHGMRRLGLFREMIAYRKPEEMPEGCRDNGSSEIMKKIAAVYGERMINPPRGQML